MTKITLAVFAVLVWAIPTSAGPSTCFGGCATKHDGREAACRVKSGSDVVKRCLDGANKDYASCRQDCSNKYKLNEQKATPGAYGTQPSSGTPAGPSRKPVK